MLSWKQKSGTQDSSFRSSLFSTVSFPFAGGAIFTGCYIRWDSCVQHNVLFPRLSHRSLSSWPWWQQKECANNQSRAAHKSQITLHSLAAFNGQQILLIYQDSTSTNAHWSPFCDPIIALILGINQAAQHHLAPETSQYFIRYIT